MDAFGAVEREIDRVVSKCGGINEHTDRILKEAISI